MTSNEQRQNCDYNSLYSIILFLDGNKTKKKNKSKTKTTSITIQLLYRIHWPYVCACEFIWRLHSLIALWNDPFFYFEMQKAERKKRNEIKTASFTDYHQVFIIHTSDTQKVHIFFFFCFRSLFFQWFAVFFVSSLVCGCGYIIMVFVLSVTWMHVALLSRWFVCEKYKAINFDNGFFLGSIFASFAPKLKREPLKGFMHIAHTYSFACLCSYIHIGLWVQNRITYYFAE